MIATDEAVEAQQQQATDASKTTPNEEFGVARGVDFRGVQTVVNVDMPLTAEEYVHRIGRTARAGASGIALSIVEAEEEDELLASDCHGL